MHFILSLCSLLGTEITEITDTLKHSNTFKFAIFRLSLSPSPPQSQSGSWGSLGLESRLIWKHEGVTLVTDVDDSCCWTRRETVSKFNRSGDGASAVFWYQSEVTLWVRCQVDLTVGSRSLHLPFYSFNLSTWFKPRFGPDWDVVRRIQRLSATLDV